MLKWISLVAALLLICAAAVIICRGEVLLAAGMTWAELDSKMRALHDSYYQGVADNYQKRYETEDEEERKQWLLDEISFWNNYAEYPVHYPEGNRLFFNSKKHLCSLVIVTPIGGPDSYLTVMDTALPDDAYYNGLVDDIE